MHKNSLDPACWMACTPKCARVASASLLLPWGTHRESSLHSGFSWWVCSRLFFHFCCILWLSRYLRAVIERDRTRPKHGTSYCLPERPYWAKYKGHGQHESDRWYPNQSKLSWLRAATVWPRPRKGIGLVQDGWLYPLSHQWPCHPLHLSQLFCHRYDPHSYTPEKSHLLLKLPTPI